MPTKHSDWNFSTLQVKIIRKILDGVKTKQEANGNISPSASVRMKTGLNKDKNCYLWLLL